MRELGILGKWAFAASVVGGLGVAGGGCLTRPVTKQEPTTKTNFTALVKQQAVDKIDILFMIDNSASMGDKQELLGLAVPDLVKRLVTPNCVDENDPNKIVGTSDPQGNCAGGGKPEFKPVHDMHIGVVSSSLGGFGSDSCKDGETNPTDGSLDRHNNDRGHLINRTGDKEVPAANADPSNFLAWFPQTEANTGKTPPAKPISDSNALINDFKGMIQGVHEYGCGLEAQMESWYRFLIQPDPWASVVRDGNKAKLEGVDGEILKQRKDFLRPDSLVAVIVVTDEDDSTPDPLAINGQGWAYSNSAFPGSKTNGGAARGTKICETNPGDPGCTSCGFGQTPNDPNCTVNGGYYDPSDDTLNVRYFRMKQRFGVDPQYPITRYINGLTSKRVPNRDGEHPKDKAGNPSPNYVGDANCTNPLYARDLPDDPGKELCKLIPGPRTSDLVFYAVIGGVPNELLHFDPNDADKSRLSEADWVKILGKDPIKYDYTGIDPHMIQSITPRAGLPDPTAPDNADPIHGREWDTKTNVALDLQYACTFPLKTQKNCKDPKYVNACDCDGTATMPLCAPNPADGNKKSLQVRAKAYPTVRELEVARALGDQAIVASICPIHVDEQGAGDPLFGYRPAVKAIVDRLKNALAQQCLPQPLVPDSTGKVPCLILATLGNVGAVAGDPEAECAKFGLKVPDSDILAKFREAQAAEAKALGGDAGAAFDETKYPVCEYEQIPEPAGSSCTKEQKKGWCYVVNSATAKPAGNCPQAITFTEVGNPGAGIKISLQCIEQQGAGTAAPAASGP
jgi:hypothetical protein